MDSPKLLSIPGIAHIKRNHRETGEAIQKIVEYINRLPAPQPIKEQKQGQ